MYVSLQAVFFKVMCTSRVVEQEAVAKGSFDRVLLGIYEPGLIGFCKRRTCVRSAAIVALSTSASPRTSIVRSTILKGFRSSERVNEDSIGTQDVQNPFSLCKILIKG